MRTRERPGRQVGFALITALLVLLVVTGIGVGMVLMSSTETAIARNFRDQQVATAAARAGLEEVRDRLLTNATNTLANSLPTALPGAAGGVLYVTNGSSQPWLATDPYTDTEICNEVTVGVNGVTACPLSGSWYTSASASSAYAASPLLPWIWVRVMAKTDNSAGGTSRTFSVDGNSPLISQNRVCWNSSNELVVPSVTVTTPPAASCVSSGTVYEQVYELTALAVTPLGTRRMLQMEVTRNVPTYPFLTSLLPAVITMYTTGAGTVTCTTSGATAKITGADQNPANSPTTGVYAIAANKGSCETAATITGVPSASDYAATVPAIWSTGLATTVSSILAVADNTYTGTLGGNLGCSGATWDPRITVLDTPSATLTPSGCGILLVQTAANITMGGGTSWKGLIIVYATGNTTVHLDAGSGSISGGLLLASNGTHNVRVNFNSGSLAGGFLYDTRYFSYNGAEPFQMVASREVIN
jgi:Tfp pilus assembly protein PilX